MWLHHPDFVKVLKESWYTLDNSDQLIDIIQRCGNNLSGWAMKEFGSVRKKKKELFEKLEILQSKSRSELVDSDIKMVEADIENILKKEETMWFQRSRALWLADGDKNSTFFHKKATHRKKRNTIKSIKDECGNQITKHEDIVEIVRDYFVQIFSKEAEGYITTVVDILEHKVTAEMNEMLTKPYTTEEVQKVIKQMHPSKSPGPDGMTPLFYQNFWNICKHDVLKEVLGILNLGRSPKSINHTHVVLIPKVKKPQTPKDFRPISLSNVVCRILTKTMANRLKHILPHIISDSQSAFVPGRLITDNAMTAFEVFHSMKHRKKGVKGFMAMKLDMSKAYDRVDWLFLESVMLKLGFCRTWVNLVMSCVQTISYAVIINGKPSDPFVPERGLRQGDPLSPFLFLFCAEAFSALLNKAERDEKIHGMVVARQTPQVSHLFFADDTVLFCRANNREADEIKSIISRYERASGQRINLEKTAITFIPNIQEEKRREICSILGVIEVAQHSKYLGLPTLIGRSKKAVFATIVEKIMQKMKDWKEKNSLSSR